jgi:hypothetical protein
LQVKPHVLALHDGVACATCVVHMLPHMPQLLLSIDVFVHVIEHNVIPDMQPDAHE